MPDPSLSPNRGRLDLCIIAQNAYGALHGKQAGHIGGAERQTSMMAKWLASRGHRVSIVTWDEGQTDGESIDSVSVYKLCRESDGVPILRFFVPRLTSLYSALKRANARIYYHNSAEAVTGLVALWCRNHSRSFVYSVASDVACEAHLPTLGRRYEKALYRKGIREAKRVVVQTRRQQRLLMDSFKVDSDVLPMPCKFIALQESEIVIPSGAPRVAWVGRIDLMKRMEWVLDIARMLPDIQFDIVGANMDLALRYEPLTQYAKDLFANAQTIPNVKWHGSLPSEEITRIYRQSRCLCCTSVYEGFPNTFLEAWSQGRPIVSSFDPDNLIKEKDLGFYGASVSELAEGIKKLTDSPEGWLRQSKRCLEYFSQNHAIEKAMPRFEALFQVASGES
jgi:glycosyltransferase involved in cell wall biosynthesis